MSAFSAIHGSCCSAPRLGPTPRQRQVAQGKPVARRGRKARDLSETARLPTSVKWSGLRDRDTEVLGSPRSWCGIKETDFRFRCTTRIERLSSNALSRRLRPCVPLSMLVPAFSAAAIQEDKAQFSVTPGLLSFQAHRPADVEFDRSQRQSADGNASMTPFVVWTPRHRVGLEPHRRRTVGNGQGAVFARVLSERKMRQRLRRLCLRRTDASRGLSHPQQHGRELRGPARHHGQRPHAAVLNGVQR